ncbi:MAG: hypothetical protein KDA57_19215, partial [Planctomycetales bacterium]|nr:hypothetical protein [Planctomycetales bacterium]
MTDPRCTPEKRGLTAVEVVAATLLASLLMVAMLGVLRGLKAQEAALEVRRPIPSWQRTLDGVLEHDLANSRTFSLTPTSLTLNGFAGRDSGVATWQPAAITYQVLTDGERNWLVRQVGAHHELVLA